MQNQDRKRKESELHSQLETKPPKEKKANYADQALEVSKEIQSPLQSNMSSIPVTAAPWAQKSASSSTAEPQQIEKRGKYRTPTTAIPTEPTLNLVQNITAVCRKLTSHTPPLVQ